MLAQLLEGCNQVVTRPLTPWLDKVANQQTTIGLGFERLLLFARARRRKVVNKRCKWNPPGLAMPFFMPPVIGRITVLKTGVTSEAMVPTSVLLPRVVQTGLDQIGPAALFHLTYFTLRQTVGLRDARRGSGRCPPHFLSNLRNGRKLSA